MFVFICMCGDQDPLFETYLALVHTRFSTNTFPSWERAHPLRLVIQYVHYNISFSFVSVTWDLLFATEY